MKCVFVSVIIIFDALILIHNFLFRSVFLIKLTIIILPEGREDLPKHGSLHPARTLYLACLHILMCVLAASVWTCVWGLGREPLALGWPPGRLPTLRMLSTGGVGFTGQDRHRHSHFLCVCSCEPRPGQDCVSVCWRRAAPCCWLPRHPSFPPPLSQARDPLTSFSYCIFFATLFLKLFASSPVFLSPISC